MASPRFNHDAVIGNNVLSAWCVVPGVIRVQTRSAKHAERMTKRSDCRLVAYSVVGGYLRVFEFEGKTLGWAADLIQRYTGAGEGLEGQEGVTETSLA